MDAPATFLCLIAVACVSCVGLAAGQQDFYGWLESSNNNKPVAPTEPRGPNSCVWEDAPEDGYSFTTCPSGICSDQRGSYKRNGTIRFTWCKKNYALAQGSDRDLCVMGAWTSSSHKCTPCGRSSVTSTPQSQASTSSPGSFPWTATIYTKNVNPSTQAEYWELACSGILVSPSSVLTAGHCVGDVTTKNVRVGLGKTRSEVDDKESNAIVSDVREIVRPAQFERQTRPTDQDVVMLVLSDSVSSNPNIMPVCLDWTGSMKPKLNEVGFLAGWDQGDQDLTLKWGYKKYVDNDTCIKQLRSRDRELVSADKFCLEEAKGVSGTKGDGAGVTFVRDGAHYVYGVTSGKVETQRKDLRLITDLISDGHRTWLQRNWRRLHRGSQLLPAKSQVEEGVCSKDSECRDDQGCVGKKCVDLCLTACGVNSECTMRNHLPVCTCKSGYKGNAYDVCVRAMTLKDETQVPKRSHELVPGEVCKQDGLSVWTCKFEGFCTKATDQQQSGAKMETCGTSEDGEAIVCCEPDQLQPPSKLQSKSKCRWFAQSVYTEVTSPGGGVELKDTCSIPEDRNQPKHGEYLTFGPGEFPHLGIIGDEVFNNWHYGNLVSERWFLSSAFCATSDSCTKKVRMGIYDNSNGDGKGLPEYDVLEKHIHPGYDDDAVYDSIGLYKLKTAVRFSQFIRPACLVAEHKFPGTKGIIIGTLDGTLKKTTSEILPNGQCNITNTGVRDESMYCVNTYRTDDSIIMYSGFPMVVPLQEPYCMYALLGMATYGGEDGPEGYMRVSPYLPWIENLMYSGFPMVVPLQEPYCMYALLGMATYGGEDGPEGYMRVSHYLPWLENLVWPQ